jgi:hypothetical protein
MVDPVQFVLLVVIVILTLLLVILGTQIFFILSEARKAVSKTNVILEKADSITESVKTPLAAISSITLGVKAASLLSVAKFIRNLLDHDKKSEGEENGKQK